MPTPPAFLRRLIDDAAIFPPGNAPLDDAVREHLAMRQQPRDEVVGPFVVDVERLRPAATLAGESDALLDVSVVVRPPATVGHVLQIAREEKNLDLVGVEVVLTSTGSALGDDLDALSAPLATAVPRPTVWIELPWSTPRNWPDDLARVATKGFALKIRTGGLTAPEFPPVDTLAQIFVEAARLSLPFKCTAGLHSPVRHADATTQATHHGFLNLLIAASAARAGASERGVADILLVDDAGILVRRMRTISEVEMRATRDLFRSYGSCSIDEPLTELVQLGVLEPEGAR